MIYRYLLLLLIIIVISPQIAQGSSLSTVGHNSTDINNDNTVTIGMENLPNSVIPLLATGSLSGQVAGQLFSGLVRLDKNGLLQPYLAESFTYSENHKTVSITLRPNIFFHDDQSITSEDVVFSLYAAKDLHPFRVAFEHIRDIEAVTPTTLRVHFNIPQPHFMKLCIPSLVPILPKHVFKSFEGIRNSTLDNIVGSGPFALAESSKTHIRLEKFAKFFIHNRPYLDGITFMRYNSIGDGYYRQIEGELDITPFRWDTYSLANLEDFPYLKVGTREYENIKPYFVIQFNLNSPPFDDILVRKALTLAVNRTFLAQKGFGRPTVPMFGPITQNDPFFKQPSYSHQYDIKKANELLDLAGFPRNEAGMRMKINLAVPPYISKTLVVAEFLQYTFARTIGVDVVIQATQNFPQWVNLITSGKYHSTIDELFSWHDPFVGLHRIYASTNRVPKRVWSNTIFFNDKEVDTLLTKASVTRDSKKRKAFYADIQEKIGKQYTSLWLASAPYTTVYNTRVSGLDELFLGTMSPMDNVWISPSSQTKNMEHP